MNFMINRLIKTKMIILIIGLLSFRAQLLLLLLQSRIPPRSPLSLRCSGQLPMWTSPAPVLLDLPICIYIIFIFTLLRPFPSPLPNCSPPASSSFRQSRSSRSPWLHVLNWTFGFAGKLDRYHLCKWGNHDRLGWQRLRDHGWKFTVWCFTRRMKHSSLQL